MKNLLTPICFLCFALFGYAQNMNNDHYEGQLSNIDTVPDFETKTNKLKIMGVIYENDGVTPAKNVLLSIYQANEEGNYEEKNERSKRWIKTNNNGEYTFYTFVPGSAIIPITFPRRKGPKKIFATIKEPSGKAEYDLNAFVFDDDPLLSKSCRKRLKRKGIDTILKLEKRGDIYVATKNIVLEGNVLK